MKAEGKTLDELFKSLEPTYGKLLHKIEAPISTDSEPEMIDVLVISPEMDRTVCGQFERFIDGNPDKAREILVKHCVKHGLDEVLGNNVAFRAVSTFLIELLPTAKVRIKN
ncbi:MAG: hypothetical protein RIE86_09130 [Imperialibacter sp.]|uniref:hypothetical protein n=1 Tax=Imperialibacter sp. TaxID=2038411 RepID=UPI0032EC0B6A